MGTGSFPGVKRPGHGVDHPPHLVPMLKKEQSYTSTPPLGLRGLLQGELCLYLIDNRNCGQMSVKSEERGDARIWKTKQKVET